MNLSDIFDKEGPLSQEIPHFNARPSQLAMAEAITDTIVQQETLVAEAGTGTGKTVAYLVPALLSQKRVLLSTATKTLQDQLFQKDLPAVRRALKLPLTIALLKGRENYLCLHRLQQNRQESVIPSDIRQMQTIDKWSKITISGDKAELPTISDQASIWQSVTSTKDNCLGSDCRDFNDCFVMRARREAQAADVVVVNHHLFLADLVLKENDLGELLPTVGVFIFDEAHQLPEIASLFFDQSLSTGQLSVFGQDIIAYLQTLPISQAAIAPLIRQWDSAIGELKALFPSVMTRFAKSEIKELNDLYEKLDVIVDVANHWTDLLTQTTDASPECQLLIDRLDGFVSLLTQWKTPQDEDHLDWVETTLRQLRIHRTPLSPASHLAPHWESPPAARVFLSATLAVENDFSHFMDEMGLTDVRTCVWESPFNYEHQTLLYVPLNLPDPNANTFTECVIAEAMTLMAACPGGAFFLFTSLAALQTAKTLVSRWNEESTQKRMLLVQGDQSRSELLKRFRADGHAILLGSYSFWEGVDVAGPSLSLVVIDKIPFQSPDDPIFQAKSDKARRAGKNPFMTLQLPRAIISLKQGTGRLIRSEIDRGVLMIGDNRLFTKSYGNKILRSLPFTRLTRSPEETISFLTPS